MCFNFYYQNTIENFACQAGYNRKFAVLWKGLVTLKCYLLILHLSVPPSPQKCRTDLNNVRQVYRGNKFNKHHS